MESANYDVYTDLLQRLDDNDITLPDDQKEMLAKIAAYKMIRVAITDQINNTITKLQKEKEWAEYIGADWDPKKEEQLALNEAMLLDPLIKHMELNLNVCDLLTLLEEAEKIGLKNINYLKKVFDGYNRLSD